MPSFYYKALDAKGDSTNGVIEASSRKQALAKLQQQGLRPLGLDENVAQAEAPRKSFLNFGKSKSKIRYTRTSGLSFLKKLLQLHKGGVAIGDVLKILSQRLTDPALKQIAMELWKDLSEGNTLAQGIKNHPKVFDPSLVYLIEAGEATGNLVPVLENVVQYMEGAEGLRKRVLGSLAYPIFISIVALGVVMLFLFFLMPKVEGMLKSLGGDLSLSARILVGLASGLIYVGPFVIAGIILGTFWVSRYRKTPEGLYKTDAILLKIPYVNDLAINSELCRVSNLLATLLASGVNTTESLKLAERSVRNKVLLKEFQHARSMIADGASFSSAFRRSQLFPSMGLDVLSVGENTGSIAPSLMEISRVQSEVLESQLRFTTGLIASMALVFAFGLVVILTLGIVTSVLQLSQSI
jgi:type II secretory pathway component PulF